MLGDDYQIELAYVGKRKAYAGDEGAESHRDGCTQVPLLLHTNC